MVQEEKLGNSNFYSQSAFHTINDYTKYGLLVYIVVDICLHRKFNLLKQANNVSLQDGILETESKVLQHRSWLGRLLQEKIWGIQTPYSKNLSSSQSINEYWKMVY